MKAIVPWVGVYQWPDRAKFLVGTAFLEKNNSNHKDIESAIDKIFRAKFVKILPIGTELPKLMDYRHGELILVYDDPSKPFTSDT